LTIAISAADSTAETGPNAVAGSSNKASVRSVKCTSPPKARVIDGGAAGVDIPADGESKKGD
jgi:hypothetical protein